MRVREASIVVLQSNCCC